MKLLVLSATKLEISPSLPILKKWRIPVVITGVGAPSRFIQLPVPFSNTSRKWQYKPA
ncbi:hypothetical protein LWM68_05995 [Niabella sp. W65]|nr:hypothetical protein [Niabella sp. W65]MCH7362350.1 hypothetical protein [Niabella sp. W65]ULT38315.1 hypothetical protein KRR40_24590 [Niabella sp. I65]